MRQALPQQYLFRTRRGFLPRAVGVSLLLAVVWCGTALGQQARITGVVASVDGVPLAGVIVGVQQTAIRTTTDARHGEKNDTPGDEPPPWCDSPRASLASIGRASETRSVWDRASPRGAV